MHVYDKQGEFFDNIFAGDDIYFFDMKDNKLFNLWSIDQAAHWNN